MLDIDENPLSSYSGSIVEETTLFYTIKIDCETGKHLKISIPVEDLIISAKHHLAADYVSLEDGVGLNLTAWNGIRETFIIKIQAEAALQKQTRSFLFEVI